MAATAHLTVVAPDNEKFTVQTAPARLPRRKPNAELVGSVGVDYMVAEYLRVRATNQRPVCFAPCNQ